MSFIKALSLPILAAFILSACGTKREYYEPPKVLDGKLSYTSELQSSIISANADYAVLKNGEVLDKGGVIRHFKLEKGFKLLKFEGGEFVLADNNGNLRILDENAEKIFEHKFDAAVLAATMEGDDIALILADNTIVLTNRSLGVRFSQTLTAAPARDMRVASPYFLNSIIIYPSLDGKIVIVDRASLKVARDVVVSSEDFFNNVIYLSVVDELLIAATPRRVVVVSSEQTYKFDEELRTIVVAGGSIFIFGKNGNIIKTNLALNKQKEKKFKYAIYNEASVFNEALFVFEKTGYLFKMDLNLENEKIYRLKKAVGEKAFMKEGKFYYDDKVLNLP